MVLVYVIHWFYHDGRVKDDCVAGCEKKIKKMVEVHTPAWIVMFTLFT